MKTHILLTIVLFAGTAMGAERAPLLPTTTSPTIYTIDYFSPAFTDPKDLDRFTAAPPDLLTFGKSVPITHLWGPIPLYTGENQFTGGPHHTLSWEAIALLPPEDMPQRIEHIRETVARYHAAGIREIVPYIAFHTLAGDHEKRLGFWKFYDHWNEYEKWAGPKPEHDPFDWLAVDRKGKFLEGVCGGYSPDYFAPLHRYRTCVNHPDWAEWQRRLIRMIADVGYDGCFVDNASDGDPCYCGYCKKAFRQWLDANRDLDWVCRLTTGRNIDELTLESKQTPRTLIERWQHASTAEHLGMLRRVGREKNPAFTIFPNAGRINACLKLGSLCDWLMFECTTSPGILCKDKPSNAGQITVRVTPDESKTDSNEHSFVLNDPLTWSAIEAKIILPTQIPVGKPAEFEVRIESIGDHPDDDDAAEDFCLVLSPPEGASARLEFEPKGAVGGRHSSLKPKNPPVTLKASWTPEQPGEYSVQFGFRYTDDGHPADATAVLHQAPLSRSRLCVDHMAELLFTQHMAARTIYLGYDLKKKGCENVQELALAEMAAFSGGGGVAAEGRPQAVYREFFKKHPDLFAGWRPTAPAAVLYAYWGVNPLAPQGTSSHAIHGALAAAHRPFVALVDASLPDKAEELAGYAVMYLASPAYEMSPEQVQSLKDYAGRAKLVLADDKVSINGRKIVELFGGDRVVVWDPQNPLLPTMPLAPSEGLLGNLRFALYEKPDQIAIHAVNYNVCLLDRHKQICEVDSTELRIPLPAGWQAVRATSFSPDADSATLPCTVADGVAQVTMPKLRLYQIVLLERQ